MNLLKRSGAAAMAFALALPALIPADAAPLAPVRAEPIRSVNDAPVLKVGERRHTPGAFHGGISYAGEYGLRYAPSYWHRRHHGARVSVNIYAEAPRYATQGQRSRALIIELAE